MKSSQIIWDDLPRPQSSDSQGSLKSETQLVPLHSANLFNRSDPIKLKSYERSYLSEASPASQERVIATPKIVQKSSRSSSYENPQRQYVHLTKRPPGPLITNATSRLQNRVKPQRYSVIVPEENDDGEDEDSKK